MNTYPKMEKKYNVNDKIFEILFASKKAEYLQTENIMKELDNKIISMMPKKRH